MGRLDYECPVCNQIYYDLSIDPPICCGQRPEILWTARKQPWIGIHEKDRAVVWFDPKTGRHATPGRNDVPMPSRYAAAGYERREFTTLRDLDAFCKSNNVVNQQAHYNSNGRSFDDEA